MCELDQSANTGVAEVPDTHRLDQALLTRWMEGHVEGFRGPLSVSKFKGGQSNPTYRLEAASGAYVLRRKPAGPVLAGAHAVDGEARVQNALARAGFPVARIFGFCDATGRNGIADWRFYVAFNFFRLAAIFHGIGGRAKRGSASSAHARERAKSFPQLAELGVRALEDAL